MPPLRTKRPYTKAFLCAVVVFIAGMAVFYIGTDLSPSSDLTAEAATCLAGAVILPALLTGFMARRAGRPWSMGKIVSVFLLGFAILAAVQVLGFIGSGAILI